ncbi:MAG: ACT domain-containing protein [Deltaproteobacteria bacterium]|nr:ACT domain-containing protein [Deltaproteobacteria bacterium]
MIANQLSIFAENKPGRLAAVTKILAKEKINIRATTISTSDTFGVINLLVDDPKRAMAVLTKAGMMVSLREVLAVLIEDKPGGLDRLTQLVAKENINVNNAYGFVLESSEKAIFVVEVDQTKKTEALLEKHGFRTLDTEALSAIEPFHYMKY